MTNKDQTDKYNHSSDWKEWETSGENALNTARDLLKCRRYNYACYVGQEALEMYVKAFLVQHDKDIDLANEVGHSAWLYFFNATIEYTSGMSEYNPVMHNISKNTMEKQRDNIGSKMQNPEMWGKIWLAYILAPSAMKDVDVIPFKHPGQVKNEIKNAQNDLISCCNPQLVQFLKDITGGRPIEDLPLGQMFGVLMSYKDKPGVNDKTFKRLVPLLALLKHSNAMYLAHVHQQCTRYPMIVYGQSVRFSKDEISRLGISDGEYKSKRYVTNTHYTQKVAQNMLNKFEIVIDDIKYYLHHNY